MISRDSLAKFLPDNDTIRRFEKLFQAVANDTPESLELIFRLLQELSIDIVSADSRGVAASDAVARLSRDVELMASSPSIDTSRTEALELIASALQILATRPGFELPRSFPVDYIDFDQVPPFVAQTARVGWNPTDDTLNIHHSDGVTQQVGQELYGRITNNTGASIANGVAIGINPATNSYVLYVADGSLGTLNVVGITTQIIPNGSPGRVTVWGRVHDLDTTGTPVGEVWAAGDILYVSTTIAGGLTRVKPTAPNLSIPIAQVLVVSSTIGQIAVRPTIEQQLFYGQFVKTTDQVPSAINTANTITWPAAAISNGVSIGAPASRIVVANAGLYKFSASFQLTSSSAAVKNVWFWFRKNGSDIANSALITSVDSATAIRAPSRSLLISLAANDYVELMWASDSVNVTLDAVASTAFAPAAPAAILTVQQEQQ